jgi:hypothetical protein
MLHLSANNLRLVPSHLASNFSFHAWMPVVEGFQQHHPDPETIELDENMVYLTFTLSDGDQLMAMSTAELGNWHQPERGKVAFNWETQPLLVELAPALLEKYFRTATVKDCLIAGPSGAGYTIQPLMGQLGKYLDQSMVVCKKAGMDVITSYDGAPSDSILRTLMKHASGITGYLAGYVHFNEHIQQTDHTGTTFLSNRWPPVDKVFSSAEEVLEGVRALVEGAQPPAFIAVHLFAYRTSITDVYNFVETLDPQKVQVVRGDEMLILTRKYNESK